MPTIEVDGFLIDIDDQLGQGSFASVFRAKDLKTENFVAAKEILTRNRAQIERAYREVESMKDVSHPNLVKYVHYYKDPRRKFYIFLELCDIGDLVKYFVDTNPDTQESFQLMQQMTVGVTFLHGKKIVHRDIKPGNILLVSRGENQIPLLKIADFGMAKMIDTTMMSFTTLRIGTRMFMAPELFETDEETRGNKLVDVFSLGLTFFSMICFKPGDKNLVPSEDNKSKLEIGFFMYSQLQEGKTERAESYHKQVVEIKGDATECKARELIQNMICCDRKKRVDLSTVAEELDRIAAKTDSSAGASGIAQSLTKLKISDKTDHTNLTIHNSSDTNVIEFYSKGEHDAIRQLLPITTRISEDFRKEDLLNVHEDTIIRGKEFTISDKNIKFQFGVRKWLVNEVLWVSGVIRNMSPQDGDSDRLILLTCDTDGGNFKGCVLYYLRAGRACSAPFSRLEDLRDRFKVNFTLHSLHISPANMLPHLRPLNFMEVARPQGREKVYTLTVKWIVDDWRTLNCTRGDVIYSKLFGDAGEQIIMCADLYPNGDVHDPEGTLSVYLRVFHLPQDSRETGIQVKWKITVNGVCPGEYTETYTEGDNWGNEYGSHSDFNSRELNIVLELEFNL